MHSQVVVRQYFVTAWCRAFDLIPVVRIKACSNILFHTAVTDTVGIVMFALACGQIGQGEVVKVLEANITEATGDRCPDPSAQGISGPRLGNKMTGLPGLCWLSLCYACSTKHLAASKEMYEYDRRMQLCDLECPCRERN